MLVAVTWEPLWVTVAFQALVSCWFPGQVQRTVQPLIGEEPALTVTVAVKPEFHWLSTWSDAVHPLPLPPVLPEDVPVVVPVVVPDDVPVVVPLVVPEDVPVDVPDDVPVDVDPLDVPPLVPPLPP
jgi:hypothetical protein